MDQEAAEKDQDTSTTCVDLQAERKSDSLSSKIRNLPVLNGSLQTVSKTCKDIRESNAYVKYGLDVAESSLDKVMKAGKSVLDVSALAPVTAKAIENIQYLDKEAGVIVCKFFGSKAEPECHENEELQKNGALPAENGIQELPKSSTVVSTSLLSIEETTVGYLSRKFFQITSSLFYIPIYAIIAILHLFQFPPESTRKRKERGSISEELQKLEPSPVKRKYGDRKSSSDEGSLVEILHVDEDYISEDDADYTPPEDALEETDDVSTDSDEELAKEAEDLKQDLKDQELTLVYNKNSERINRKMDKSESKDLKKGGESSERESPQKPTENASHPKPENRESLLSENGTKTNEKEPLNSLEMSQKKNEDTTKDEKESKDDTNKKDKSATPKDISSSSKTRKSSKSPLRFLSSHGRRKSEKEKAKSADKELPEHDAQSEKAEESEKAKISENAKKGEKSEKAEKTKKKDNAEKAENAENAESVEKVENAEKSEKHEKLPSMNLVSGPLEMFKMSKMHGGKKSQQ